MSNLTRRYQALKSAPSNSILFQNQSLSNKSTFWTKALKAVAVKRDGTEIEKVSEKIHDQVRLDVERAFCFESGFCSKN